MENQSSEGCVEPLDSNNYLALRNSSGHYFLNGNWRIDYPQKMDICGTTFHYERKYKNSKAKGPLTLFAPENIRALGPTTCSLYVVVSISADQSPKLPNQI